MSRRVHYVLSTHWDREWYQPFQDYRYRLVQLIDRILDGRLQGPFTTDGQSILIEDYLEVRPERREQVDALLRQGKIKTGPWYVLPDEFLVSGESLVRNLRLGRRVAREHGGEPSDAGFVCDMFGHASQLPQIFAGFGIRAVFLWRGVNAVETRNLLWRGADGTEIPVYRFGRDGYCSYAFSVRRAHEPPGPFDEARAAKDLDEFIRSEADRTAVDPILLFDGGDHLEWDPRQYQVAMRRPDVLHSTLDDWMKEMLPQVDRIGSRLEGELREPGKYGAGVDQQWLIPGVASSRVWIKQANAECQSLLCQWAEPMAAFAHGAIGRDFGAGFLDVAWKWLLQNHPHDSICGCGVDAVHEDMKFRFSQARQIASRIASEATAAIAASVEGEPDENELRVCVFNALPRPLERAVDLTLPIPTGWPCFNEFFGFEPMPAFRILDASGVEIPYQRLSQEMSRKKYRVYDTRFPRDHRTNDVKVCLPLSLPALGYTTLSVRAGDPGRPVRYGGAGLARDERSMANDRLAVRIESNGSLEITDRNSGQSYAGLLAFEDSADIGDGWYHGPAVNDEVFVSTACRSQVAIVHDGPRLTTFRVRTTMSVPAEFDFGRMRRSDRFVDLAIDSRISLRAGADWVEIETTVDNAAGDHRLRALFPSGAEAKTCFSDAPFDVVERPIALRKDNSDYRELEVETRPQQTWTAVGDARRGLAVVATGLMEAAVRDLPARPIALTLFRATRRTVLTDGEPLGQLRGPMKFRYWIVPGAPDRVRLCEMGQELAAGFRQVALAREDVKPGKRPRVSSFLRLEGPAVLTSARREGDAVEVRMFNPCDSAIEAVLHTQAGRSRQVDLESRPLEEWREHGGPVRMSLKPKQLLTLQLSRF
jgi:alpha-mannosidase/mannosylglycerate hydrolase